MVDVVISYQFLAVSEEYGVRNDEHAMDMRRYNDATTGHGPDGDGELPKTTSTHNHRMYILPICICIFLIGQGT